MSVDRLRAAAKVLRDMAEAAYWEAEPPWTLVGQWIEAFDGTEIPTSRENTGNNQDEVSTYIATMHPGVGLALADWLDRMARAIHGTSAGDVPFEDDALLIADLILGSES